MEKRLISLAKTILQIADTSNEKIEINHPEGHSYEAKEIKFNMTKEALEELRELVYPKPKGGC